MLIEFYWDCNTIFHDIALRNLGAEGDKGDKTGQAVINGTNGEDQHLRKTEKNRDWYLVCSKPRFSLCPQWPL